MCGMEVRDANRAVVSLRPTAERSDGLFRFVPRCSAGAGARQFGRRYGWSHSARLKRFSASCQLTMFHQAVMYSGRRFWYFR